MWSCILISSYFYKTMLLLTHFLKILQNVIAIVEHSNMQLILRVKYFKFHINRAGGIDEITVCINNSIAPHLIFNNEVCFRKYLLINSLINI